MLKICFPHGSIVFSLPSRVLCHHNSPSSIIYGPHPHIVTYSQFFWISFRFLAFGVFSWLGAARHQHQQQQHQRWFLFSATSPSWMCLFTLMYLYLPFMSPYITPIFKSSASTSMWFHGHDHHDDQLSSTTRSEFKLFLRPRHQALERMCLKCEVPYKQLLLAQGRKCVFRRVLECGPGIWAD